MRSVLARGRDAHLEHDRIFFCDGCCDTRREDFDSHTVCAVMTTAFLEFSKSRGNDLSTPVPEVGF